MASNPTRKTEVQAYSFEVRRMNSALVRRDPVMLHDPLRTHSRATIVGVILSMVGLLGFLIFGILKPSPQPPDGLGIVIGKESLQVYVYVEKPERLIPTYNLASARLILMAQQDKAKAAGQGAEGGQPAGGPQEPVEVVQPTVIPDDRLEEIQRGRLQGIPGADVQLPGPDQRISDTWSVCHNLPLDENLQETPDVQLAKAAENQETAVLAGLQPTKLGEELQANQAIYAQAENGERYLIYRPAETENRQANMVRALVTDADRELATALGLDGKEPRPMSFGVLNAIEPVDSLSPPAPAGRGEPSDVQLVDGQATAVGEVFRVDPGGNTRYFVVLQTSVQEVSQGAAELIRYSFSPSKQILEVAPERLNQLNTKQSDSERLKLDDFPEVSPTVLDVQTFPTTCLGWSIDNGKGRTTLYMGRTGLPFPKGKDDLPQRIEVGKANEDGIRINYFYMPPGRGAVVHSATSEAQFESGQIQLVSDRGLRYGIPDVRTAQGLGLNPVRPGPESIIRLLPTGTSLNKQAAEASYDSFEPPAGSADYSGDDNPAAQSGG